MNYFKKIVFCFSLLNLAILHSIVAQASVESSELYRVEKKVFESFSSNSDSTIDTRQKTEGLFSALQSYRKLRKRNLKTFSDFASSVHQFKKDLKKNQSFATEVNQALASRDHQKISDLLSTYSFAQNQDTDYGLNHAFSCQCDMDDRPGAPPADDWHLILYGEEKMDCSALSKDEHKEKHKYVFGPGLYAAAGYEIIFCAKPQEELGTNVGFVAKGGALLSGKTGFYFGQNGICFELGLGLGFGGVLGVAVITD